MKAVRYFLSSAAAAGLAVSANAQPPLNLVAPPPPVPVGIAPQPAVPGAPTIWDKLGISQQQREYCRRNTCRTPFGAAMNTIVSPLSTLSGGLIPGFCPLTPSLAELQDPGAVGAAAKVKQDRAGAEERIKAVKYLATVDCHYWPEAEDALIGALRNDRNECVRYEAAVALASGCCCTPKVVIALSNTVGCGTSDGGFMEKSARVRQAAEVALEKCMPCCACGDLPTLDLGGGKKNGGGGEKGKGEKPKDDKQSMLPVDDSPSAELKAYYKKVAKLPKAEVMNYAARALEIGRQIGYQNTAPSNPTDLAAAGVPAPTQAAAVAHRPTNLWDMLSGQDQPPATFAYTQMPTRVATPPAATPVKTASPSPIPKTLVSAFSSQTAEPPMRKMPPAVVASAPTPTPVLSSAFAPTPVATPSPVPVSNLSKMDVFTPSVPARVPASVPSTAVVEFKPVVEKKKMPTTESVKTESSSTVQPAGIARVVSPPAPAVATPPTPAVATPPAPAVDMLVPVFTPAPTPNGTMMAEPVSLRQAIPARR